MIIAQISDFHVRAAAEPVAGGFDTAGALARCIAHMGASDPAPDVVLATGDLAQDGGAGDYAALTAILAPLTVPFVPVPGNHDERAAFLDAFGHLPWLQGCGDRIRYTVDHFPVRLVALDTVVPGSTHGALTADDVVWLDERLAAAPTQPTLILMHHPPVRTGVAAMDAAGLREGADALGMVVARHPPQIERIVCGHVHRSVHARWCGTVVTTALSTGQQIALDLRADGASGYVSEPPGYHLHVWLPDAGLISHVVFFDAAAAVRPFQAAAVTAR